MGVVYQLTFFVALALIAIVVTIFVFAVSQIGRATESASREQQDILLRQKQAKVSQIQKIQEQLEEDKKVGHLNEAKLLQQITNTKDEIAGYDDQLSRLQERVKLIRRRGAVVYPGACFLATIVLTTIASGLAEGQNPVALPLWIVSIGTLVFGIYRVYRTLGAIEEVTVTSREAIEKLPEAVKVALRELEEERKPELSLTFKDKQPPFRMITESEESIKFQVGLSKGDIARKAEVAFFAPPGFEFSGSTSTRPAIAYPDHVTTLINLGDLAKPLIFTKSVKLKAPSKPDTYPVLYKLYCEGFYGNFEKFEIVVEKPKHPV